MDFRTKTNEQLEADIRTLQGLMSKPDATPEELQLHQQHIEQIDAELTRRRTVAPPAKFIPTWIVAASVFVFVSGLAYWSRQIEHQRLSPEERRKAEVEKVFAGWNGEVPALRDYIKNNMNDPSSFEHVKTTYRDDTDFLLVEMEYRGKNAFNATITKTVMARITLDGKVLSIVSE